MRLNLYAAQSICMAIALAFFITLAMIAIGRAGTDNTMTGPPDAMIGACQAWIKPTPNGGEVITIACPPAREIGSA